MTQEKITQSTHEQLTGNWRNHTGYTFLSSLDFEDKQEVTLTISKVTRETAVNPQNPKEEKVMLTLWFEKADRPLGLNKTNAKVVTAITKTPYVEKWIGAKVTIYKTTTPAFGKQQPCLRIKPATQQ